MEASACFEQPRNTAEVPRIVLESERTELLDPKSGKQSEQPSDGRGPSLRSLISPKKQESDEPADDFELDDDEMQGRRGRPNPPGTPASKSADRTLHASPVPDFKSKSELKLEFGNRWLE